MTFALHGRSRADTLRTFQRIVVGPYFHEDTDKAWESLRRKARWSDLHWLFVDFRTSISPDDLNAALRLPYIRSQVNATDSWGHTPLYYAVYLDPAFVEPLLRAGANPWLV